MIRFMLLFAWLFPSLAHASFPPPLAPKSEQADAIRVYKAQRKMDLLLDGKVIHSYRNAQSRFHLSLRVSYPNEADRRQARARGVDPGGDIMVHGATPVGYTGDWTEGCIAVTNAQIEEIWRLVPVGTPIHIAP